MGNMFGWRSLLYVPAHRERLVAGAHKRGADAVILDLEDGVPAEYKEAARAALKDAVPRVGAHGADVMVRINKPWPLAWRDLEAAVAAGASGLLLPKVESTCGVRIISEHLDELEPDGRTSLLALIESARGLTHVAEIAAASPRLRALIPGNEDLANNLGIAPEPERMLHVSLPILLAAGAQGLEVYGTLGGNADFRNLQGYRERVKLSKDWGFSGATCIHPDQVSIIHEVYRPDNADIDEAKRIVERFEAGAGDVVALEGKMVDRPVYLRAKGVLERARRW